ncbi:MAG TPA: isoprenylcysteine carboxylmethyltransferase family protein [Candidatus Binataceae bacterium]|nr:isoprenylcysteine carboxylmethyltransferase family protein [Candidatus Binataceae bacterium]
MNETADHIGNGGGIRIHPPLLAGGLLLAGLLLHLLGVHHHPHHAVHFHQFMGLLLVAAGVGVSAYAAATFSARNTTLNPYGQPSEFVKLGPYNFSRNPMYLGITTLLLGFAVFFWSPVMVLAPIIFFLIIDRAVIPGEERSLERTFGIAYEDYQRRVRRWL